MPITILEDDIVEEIRLLQKKEERLKEKLFLIEEVETLNIAFRYGFQLVKLIFCPELIPEVKTPERSGWVLTRKIEKSTYDKLSTNLNFGIIAIVRSNFWEDYGYGEEFRGRFLLRKFKVRDIPIVIIGRSENLDKYMELLLEVMIEKKVILLFSEEFDFYSPERLKNHAEAVLAAHVIFENKDNVMGFVKKNHLTLLPLNEENLKPSLSQGAKSKTVFLIGDLSN